MKKRRNLKVLLICIAIVYLAACVGSIFTSISINSGSYESVKPSIAPPSWVFPIVWNILFFMIALSLYFSWVKAKKKNKKKVALVFGINLILNVFWSILFFGLLSPLYAFIEIFALWISIISMIYVTYKIYKKAAYLLIPYFLWVSFAIVLNYFSVRW